MTNRVFVGNLTDEVSEDDLRTTFEKYGEVEEVFMKAGFAFVHMVDEKMADDAVKGLDGGSIGPASGVKVDYSRGGRRGGGRGGGRGGYGGGDGYYEQQASTNRVFVGNLTDDVSEDDLRNAFSQYGDIDGVFMKTGFAFVHMADSSMADNAIRGLDGGNIGPASGVRLDHSRGGRGGGGGFRGRGGGYGGRGGRGYGRGGYGGGYGGPGGGYGGGGYGGGYGQGGYGQGGYGGGGYYDGRY